jgi:hypothetical protein
LKKPSLPPQASKFVGLVSSKEVLPPINTNANQPFTSFGNSFSSSFLKRLPKEKRVRVISRVIPAPSTLIATSSTESSEKASFQTARDFDLSESISGFQEPTKSTVFLTPERRNLGKSRLPPASPEGRELKDALSADEQVQEIRSSINFAFDMLFSQEIEPRTLFTLNVKTPKIQFQKPAFHKIKNKNRLIEFIYEGFIEAKPESEMTLDEKLKLEEQLKSGTKIKSEKALVKLIQSENFKIVLNNCSNLQLSNLFCNLQLLVSRMEEEKHKLAIQNFCRMNLENFITDRLIYNEHTNGLYWNTHSLIQSMLARLYQDKPEGRNDGVNQALMRQSNPSDTIEKLQKFCLNRDATHLSVYHSYAILKTLIMRVINESTTHPLLSFLEPIKKAKTKEEFIKEVISLKDNNQKVFVLDLLSLLYASLNQVWLEYAMRSGKDIGDQQVKHDTTKNMLTGAHGIALLFCPGPDYSLDHSILIQLLLDYPTQFEVMKASLETVF